MFTFFAQILAKVARRTARPARISRPRAVHLGVEELTPRVVPSAGPFGLAALRLAGTHGHGFFSSASTDSDGATGFSDPSRGGDACGQHGATLSASLSNASGATGQAFFNAANDTLSVSVQGATASSSLAVTVDGTNVGTLTTNASGSGHANFSNVTAQAGSTITAGDLQGTFAQIKFAATLTGSTVATGSADYNALENWLHVHITGAAANTTYNVTVNNVVVGQLTTNASGAGKLKLTPTGVTIASGSTISISDAAGDPAILQGTFA
jgi:hypothetical protein